MTGRAHFLFNKYLVSPISANQYYLSYCVQYKALWFRTAKVASRSIDQHFKDASRPGGYFYSSRVGYAPWLYKDWFKFAFVRHPVDRLVSAWKDKVVEHNMYKFPPVELARMQDLEAFIGWLETQDVDNADEHLQAQYKQIDMERVDFIGHLERFDEDFAIVAKKVGMQFDRLHRLNATQPRAVHIPDETRARIAEVYRRDMELYYPEG